MLGRFFFCVLVLALADGSSVKSILERLELSALLQAPTCGGIDLDGV